MAAKAKGDAASESLRCELIELIQADPQPISGERRDKLAGTRRGWPSEGDDGDEDRVLSSGANPFFPRPHETCDLARDLDMAADRQWGPRWRRRPLWLADRAGVPLDAFVRFNFGFSRLLLRRRHRQAGGRPLRRVWLASLAG